VPALIPGIGPSDSVGLRAGSPGDLRPALVDTAGLTLYRFDRDGNDPPWSACDTACARIWPPVIVEPEGRLYFAGVRKTDISVFRRPDGRLQVAVGGHPVYRFSGDAAADETRGHGADEAWFGVEPDGGKAFVYEGDEPEVPDATVPVPGTPAAHEVVLFDAVGYPDSGTPQRVIGPGCHDVTLARGARSVTADGWFTLWTGRDCTGLSTVIYDASDDLGTLGPGAAATSLFVAAER
jgi:predicted lipoprotein with Yx(FWY)xxD motif